MDAVTTTSFELGGLEAISTRVQGDRSGIAGEAFGAVQSIIINHQLTVDEQLAAVDRTYLLGFHTYWRGRIAAVLGDRESAVRLLREAIAAGSPYYRGSQYRFHSVIDFESLVDYPSYQELVRPKG